MSGGDLPAGEIRAALHQAADLAADYLDGVETFPVRPDTAPGDVLGALPVSPPPAAESMEAILADYQAVILPALMHWNHPGFVGYFGITGSAPGIVAELLSSTVNVNAMLWRTSPAATELEQRVCEWLRQMLGLPEGFHGHINDTASMATFLSLAVARHRADPDIRRLGQIDQEGSGALAVYASDQAHSSVDKAAIALGLGLDNVRRVPSDDEFRMSDRALAEMLSADRAAGRRPIAVVATAGTTATTSVDPLSEIAAICRSESIWFHVDAAYAGSAAICGDLRPLFRGWEAADSIVVNPHKWLFTPFDCSVLFVRRPDELRRAFSVVPEYLKTDEPGVTNLMDFGVQLGRRFRALKLWMVIRAYGVEGLAERLSEHCRLARWLADQLAASPGFELIVEPRFSVVCFRLADDDRAREQVLNTALLEAVNATGSFYLSGTRLDNRPALRVAIGNIKTECRHIEALSRLLLESAEEVRTRC